MDISTHTPARGVTKLTEDTKTAWNISTHTPARGVTGFLEALKGTALISTHTPARGVTIDTLFENGTVKFLLPRPRGA